jgi:predicted DNA-binding protein (UPF0251 family)
MGRPEKQRQVSAPPQFNLFKPAGVRTHFLKNVALTLDEYEALRLADYDGFDHTDAAKLMSISRPTFTRLISRARRKVSELIVDGSALRIEGGAVHFSKNLIRCLDCETKFASPMSRNSHECPQCGSKKTEDIAAKFGHGRCCRGNR